MKISLNVQRLASLKLDEGSKLRRLLDPEKETLMCMKSTISSDSHSLSSAGSYEKKSILHVKKKGVLSILSGNYK